MKHVLLATVAVLSLAGCTRALTAFPLDPQSAQVGAMQGTITRTGMFTGDADVTVLRTGERLHGSVTVAVSQGVGTTSATVIGPRGGVATGFGTTVSSGDGYGTMGLYGPRTQLTCRLHVVTGVHGDGECLDPTSEARWALSF